MGSQFYFMIFTFIGFYEYVSSIEGCEEPVITVQPDESWCLDCIWYAASKKDNSSTCDGDVCGPFRITEPYWYDGGQQNGGYETCTKDYCCSLKTVKKYLARYQEDCNGDGVIDCFDYGAIHRLGPTGCLSKDYSDVFFERLDTCDHQKC